MNYEKLYFAFIEKYKNQVFDDGVYTEKHHIIPRHAGGDDSKQNLIRLTYRQHIFAHNLLWKAYGNFGDHLAYILMTNIDVDKTLLIRREIGKRVGGAQREFMSKLGKSHGPIQGKLNVDSGLLDSIRPLANNDSQREWAKKLAEQRIESGVLFEYIKKAQEAWTGSNHTEEFKKKRSEEYKVKYSIPENREWLLSMADKGRKVRQESSEKFSKDLILNAERNEEFLQESSSRSKNKFISPEGLEFDSPILAAKYYGNVEPYIIENWCKRGKYGWSRKPKAA